MKLICVTRDRPFDVYCGIKLHQEFSIFMSEHKNCSGTKQATMRCAQLKAEILALYCVGSARPGQQLHFCISTK